MQEALNRWRAEILARDWLTRFSDPFRLREGCDLRAPAAVVEDVEKHLQQLRDAGEYLVGDWPQEVPPRSVVRSMCAVAVPA